MGFESQDKEVKAAKKAYEVDFTVYDPDDIQSHQDKQIQEVANILSQPPQAAAILLRYFRWKKEELIDKYFQDTDKVLEDAGLGQDADAHPPRVEKVPGFMCDICCEDDADLETFAMRCGHRFCVDCYKHYLEGKIKDEGEAARIRCPGDGCNRIVDSRTLDFLVSSKPDVKDR